MATSQEIQQAIGAHGFWKQHLRKAIASGSSEMTPAHVEADNECVFGKWLRTLPIDTRSAHYDTVHSLHAEFHREAASVLRLALAGATTEASHALEVGGAFARTSAALTRAMIDWRKAIGG